jgi:DNA segregation ATPase FtsK/SpoIIIE, S-DNA-T family
MPTTSKRAPARRKPAAKSSKSRPAARSKARRGRSRSRGFNLPVLEQRQRDVLGLALIALGVFMGFVLYGSGSPAPGGKAGHALAVAFGWALGRARVLAPVTLVLGGGVLLLRPVLPALRPLRTGAACVFSGITLALAAGTLGLSSSSPPGAATTCRRTAACSAKPSTGWRSRWCRISASGSSSCSC